jgi:hypothetical protein
MGLIRFTFTRNYKNQEVDMFNDVQDSFMKWSSIFVALSMDRMKQFFPEMGLDFVPQPGHIQSIFKLR